MDVNTMLRPRTNPHFDEHPLPDSSPYQICYKHIAELGGFHGKPNGSERPRTILREPEL
jgi:hypothetical protein